MSNIVVNVFKVADKKNADKKYGFAILKFFIFTAFLFNFAVPQVHNN